MLDFHFDQPMDLEAALEPQCRVLERLANHRLLEIWRQWNAIYPPAIQFSRIEGRLRERRALEAYQAQDSSELFVLMIGPLVGWRCESDKPPLRNGVFALAVVTPPDFSWSYDFYDFVRRQDAEPGRRQ